MSNLEHTPETFTQYDEVELLGLSERGSDELPFPDDDFLQDHILQPCFSALLDPLQYSALESEIEPLAHGVASLLFRRKKALAKQLDSHKTAISGLIRSADGSEVLETQLEKEQEAAARCRQKLNALDIMSEAAAQCYEQHTARVFIPSSGTRLPQKFAETGAILEAKEWLDAEAQKERDKFPNIEGRALIVQGPQTWLDASKVWDTLDKIAERFRNQYAENLIIYTRGQKVGVDAIAAKWASQRGFAHVVFRPQWDRYKGAAPYKAMDQMLDDQLKFVLGGCLIFGADAFASVMHRKATAHDIRILQITDDRDPLLDAKGKSKSDFEKN